MIEEPWFWRSRAPAARAVAFALAPGAAAYMAARKLKDASTRPAPAPLPIICVGNATLGGVGKTPFALMLAQMLTAAGRRTAFLTRGYGGSLRGPVLFDPAAHDARAVGDESLLLAAAGPTIVSRNRPAGAAFAAARDFEVVIMDDGFQNRTIAKSLSILLVDAADPCGNGLTFPAGPLRESLAEAAARAGAVVFVGEASGVEIPGAERLPRFRARVEPTARESGRVFAFCGIGAPARFFASLQTAGFEVVGTRAFPDHHFFSAREIADLRRLAGAASARLITTEKDRARLDPAGREGMEVLPVAMTIDDPDGLLSLAIRAIQEFRPANGAARD